MLVSRFILKNRLDYLTYADNKNYPVPNEKLIEI